MPTSAHVSAVHEQRHKYTWSGRAPHIWKYHEFAVPIAALSSDGSPLPKSSHGGVASSLALADETMQTLIQNTLQMPGAKASWLAIILLLCIGAGPKVCEGYITSGAILRAIPRGIARASLSMQQEQDHPPQQVCASSIRQQCCRGISQSHRVCGIGLI